MKGKWWIIITGSCLLCIFLLVYTGIDYRQNDTKTGVVNENSRADPSPTPKESGFGITFSIANNDTLEIKGEGSLDEETYRIVSLSISHEDWKKVKRIVVGDGITELNYNGCLDMYDAENVREIVIADSVRLIGGACFRYLTSLTTVDMGNGVREIEGFAFYACTSLREVKFSNSLRMLGKYAFGGCIRLQQLHLPESLTKIGKDCFMGCSALRRITLPDSVEFIGRGAFDECDDLSEIVLSKELETWKEPGWDNPALKKIVNRSDRAWNIRSDKKRKNWYVNGKEVKTIPAGETAVAKGKRYSIAYQLDGGKLVGEMPESYEYGEICPIHATVEKEGYYCTGWSDEKYSVYIQEPAMYIVRFAFGNLLLKPLLVKYRVENIPGRGVKITLSDRGLPIVQEYYEIRYSDHEDMGGAKKKKMENESVMLTDLTKGKRYYIEFRWGSDEGNEGEQIPLSPWMGKKSVLVS